VARAFFSRVLAQAKPHMSDEHFPARRVFRTFLRPGAPDRLVLKPMSDSVRLLSDVALGSGQGSRVRDTHRKNGLATEVMIGT